MTRVLPQPDEVGEAGWAGLEGAAGPGTIHAEDAAHWRAVYRELVATMDRLLAAARERQAARNGTNGANSPQGREVELLADRLDLFRERLRWWSELGEEAENTA